MSSGFDKQITIFSQKGRLYQLEYAYAATKKPGLTSIGLKGENCVVLITQKKVSDKLVDPSFITNLHRIDKHLGMSTTGFSADARTVVMLAKNYMVDFEYKNGYKMSADLLSSKLAERAQLHTQYAHIRPFVCNSMIAGCDDEFGPQLYISSLFGTSISYKAAALGAKRHEVINLLEKEHTKYGIPVSEEETIYRGIKVLSQISSSETNLLLASEVEIGIVTQDNKEFRKLSEAEIDEILTVVAEREE
eukprot:TRINITY_DN2786_c0_g1_i2.p1 TRINITY_DN2786_c0_g1~~TRINITY_DN2786_c0_g1_i2.p1  ORF type:complete len:256 (-),score=62.48 TRINITY_DN2786_c0_g1_i2:15-758(-)